MVNAPIAVIPARTVNPGRAVLVLQNPGRGSRNYLSGIVGGLGKLGLRHCVLEMEWLWEENKKDPSGLVQKLSHLLVKEKVGAVIGYGFNGLGEVPLDKPAPAPGPAPFIRSFWEIRNLPQLMLWLDHPQWHADRIGLRPDMQPLFRSSNNYHFMKCAAHALEAERLMGWPNCFELPAAVDPEQFKPATEVTPDHDIVAIMSEKAAIPAWMRRFLAEENPEPAAIDAVIADDVRGALRALWQKEAPDGIRAEMEAMGERWLSYKQADPSQAAFRHWPKLLEEFPGGCWFLTLAYPLYMNATRILWRFREWQRRFYVGYLSRFYKVGVWGGDWSELGLGPGGWVSFHEQSRVYARGNVALNIVDGHDEEGLTLKPFEIAASGTAMMHMDCRGLSDVFAVGEEVAVFHTPRQARELAGELLGDEARRRRMAAAARARTLRDHTWERRVEAMFGAVRLRVEDFR